jgi:glycosyltransferase involved in cell wall biosynthesis
MSDGRPWPRITLVTPSLNQGDYLEQTICSVLGQGYPNLEYIIIDGGSSDGSVEIIRRYEPYLAYWVSEPDNGQVSAIKRGLRLATGEWFNWLNSDDMLLPGALKTLAAITSAVPAADWIVGTRLMLTPEGTYAATQSPLRDPCMVLALNIPDFPQDSTFLRTSFAKNDILGLNDNLQIFDTVLYLQLCSVERPVLTPALFSAMRMHPEQKTADHQRIARERQEWVTPRLRNSPVSTRFLAHLLQMRFVSRAAAAVLVWAVKTPYFRLGKQWQAVVYHYGDFRWKPVAAYKML